MKALTLTLSIAGAAAIAAGSVATVLVLRSQFSSTGEHAALLEPLAKAYAADWGLALKGIDTAVAARIDGSNRAEWLEKARNALSVGYSPDPKTFRAIPLDTFPDGASVRMSRNRTPKQLVEGHVAPGHTIVEVTWRFADSAPVKSYTLLNAQGRPLFDTLVSMPVVLGPVFRMGHF